MFIVYIAQTGLRTLKIINFIHNIQHFRSYFLQITYDFINQEIPSAFLPAFDLRSLV